MSVPTLEATASIEDACAALDEYGVVVINDYASSETLAQLRADIYPQLEDTPFGDEGFSGSRTKRLSSLFARSLACGDLITQRHMLGTAKRFLQEPNSRTVYYGEPTTITPTVQVGFAQLIQIWPGQKAQGLHRDDSVHLRPHPGPNTRMQFMLAMDDFTEEKGATLVIPGSHTWDDAREPKMAETVPAVMKTGAAAIFLGATYHAGGHNRSDEPRTGLSMAIDVGNVRQEENQYLAIPRETVLKYPTEVRELLGWRVCPPYLGWYEMNDPSVLLEDPDNDKLVARSDLFA
ncbi:phytanoyl-CoA dioxygenase family protein [Mycolicibacterium sp.]|uniref:phytanoyl-CoA dioxygenase family protein n=1 Tax=Mycolicibacterium sp. TaxID=2320850 RepID=UPI003D0E5DFA